MDQDGVAGDVLYTIMWSSDFPHSATFWPHSREKIEKDFAGVNQEDKRKLISENAARLYGFDRERA